MTDNCTISIEKFTEVLPPVKVPPTVVTPVKVPPTVIPTVTKITTTERVYEEPYNLNTLVNKIIDLKFNYYTDDKTVILSIPSFSFTFSGNGTIKIPIPISNSILFPKSFEIKTITYNGNEIFYQINNRTNHIDIMIRKNNSSTDVIVPNENITYNRI